MSPLDVRFVLWHNMVISVVWSAVEFTTFYSYSVWGCLILALFWRQWTWGSAALSWHQWKASMRKPPPQKNNVLNSTTLDTSDSIILSHNITLTFRWYCHVLWSNSRRGFGLDIGVIDHLEVVTTNKNNTIAFPARILLSSSCLVTASNNS
jgi:hypothetical protein